MFDGSSHHRRAPGDRGASGSGAGRVLLAVAWAAAALGALVLAAVQISTDPSSSLSGEPGPPAGQTAGGGAPAGGGSDVQLVAKRLRPSPSHAFDDRSLIFRDDCFLQLDEVVHPACEYANVDSDKTIVLFADSHGEPYSEALRRVARYRGVRFVALTKSFCSPAWVRQLHPRRSGAFTDCHQWKRRTMRRIVRREQPEVVVVSGHPFLEPARNGRELSGRQAVRTMIRGYAKTLYGVGRSGAHVVMASDVPRSSEKIPECVQENRDRLWACNFSEPGWGPLGLARHAARKAGGVQVLDVVHSVCRKSTCRGVVGDMIAYRDRSHLTATFARALAPRFHRRLPSLD